MKHIFILTVMALVAIGSNSVFANDFNQLNNILERIGWSHFY